MKMPRWDRYLKFGMLAILLFLSLLFIITEILRFEKDIMVRILGTNKMSVLETPFGKNSICGLLWSIYFY